MSLHEVAGNGDRRELLLALRDRLTADLDSLPPGDRVIPSLSKELRECVRELESIPHEIEGSAPDELSKRRAARLSGAEV